jgi:hypothetical protein
MDPSPSSNLTLSKGASLPSTNTLTSALLVSLFFFLFFKSSPFFPLRWFRLALPSSADPKKEAWIRGGMTTCSPVEDEIE